MIQSIAKFLLIVLAYPFLPMKDPGTSYAPSVAEAENTKGTNNILWVIAWYFGVVGLAAVFGGQLVHEVAVGFLLLWLALVFTPKVGWTVAVLLFLFGGEVLRYFVASVVLFALGHFFLTLGLQILAMTPFEYEALRRNPWDRRDGR